MFEGFLLPADHEYHEQECDADRHPHGEHGRALCAEFVIISFQIDDDNDPGQHISHVSADELREFHAVPGIGLPDEIVPSPAVLMRTEHQVDHRAQRQDVVGDKEVFQVHDGGTAAQGL